MQNSEALFKILKQRFGFEKFRDGQYEIIESVISRRDTLVVMPTGAGKSLCFQIPAVYLGGICLVISPLIALMHDQVRSLILKGIPAGCLHSGLSSDEKAKIINEVQSLSSYILFVSPERLAQDAFLDFLKKLQIKFVVIDEAHCIVEWGSEFRPAYRKLDQLKDKLNTPILALTASATPSMRCEIMKYLKLSGPREIVFGFFRPNLFLQVENCFDFENKLQLTVNEIERTRPGRILIYCSTRMQSEVVARRLSEKYQFIQFYHAGLSAQMRTKIQDEMNRNEAFILCCTCAFGMGIDYPNVRLVVHFEVPSSLEEIYQEVGRAGRDQGSARALTLYSEKDLLMKVAQAKRHSKNPSELNRKLKSLGALENYLKKRKCRHQMLSEYFGDQKSFLKVKTCKVCDFCCEYKILSPFRPYRDVGLKYRIRRLKQST